METLWKRYSVQCVLSIYKEDLVPTVQCKALKITYCRWGVNTCTHTRTLSHSHTHKHTRSKHTQTQHTTHRHRTMSHCHASKPSPDEVGDPPLQNELGDAGGGQWENGSWWHHNEGCIGKRKKAKLENEPRMFQCHLWNNVTCDTTSNRGLFRRVEMLQKTIRQKCIK